MKRKLLLIGSVPPPYHGVTKSFLRILKSEIPKKYKTKILDISDHRDLKNIGKFDFENIKIGIIGLLKLCWMCISRKPDLVYLILSHSQPAIYRDILFVLVIKLLSNARIVAHLHGGSSIKDYIDNCNRFIQILLKFSISKFDRIIVLSSLYKNIFDGILSRNRVIVIRNGVKSPLSEDERPTIKENFISYMGILSESKGLYDYLRAIELLSTRNGNTRFLIAGDWSDSDSNFKSRCFELISKSNLKDKIEFIGVVSGKKKKDFFKKTKIFIMPSFYKYEGQPAVIIEAMASGIPVISTKHQAIPEMIDDGETGFLVDPKSPNKIFEKLNIILADSSLYSKMVTKSLQKYNCLFTEEKFQNEMERLFIKILG